MHTIFRKITHLFTYEFTKPITTANDDDKFLNSLVVNVRGNKYSSDDWNISSLHHLVPFSAVWCNFWEELGNRGYNFLRKENPSKCIGKSNSLKMAAPMENDTGVIGPDGKPCRACKTFKEFMNVRGIKTSNEKKPKVGLISVSVNVNYV